jgi:hypothetical protein
VLFHVTQLTWKELVMIGVVAMAIAGAFGAPPDTSGPRNWNAHEVQTPASVSESAPWRSGEPHLAAVDDLPLVTAESVEYWLIGSDSDPAYTRAHTGSTRGVGGTGSVGFDSRTQLRQPASYSLESLSGSREVVVYTPSAEMIAEHLGGESSLVSEHYLVPAPLSSYDGSSFFVLAIGPAREDLALLEALKQDFYVITPSAGAE